MQENISPETQKSPSLTRHLYIQTKQQSSFMQYYVNIHLNSLKPWTTNIKYNVQVNYIWCSKHVLTDESIRLEYSIVFDCNSFDSSLFALHSKRFFELRHFFSRRFTILMNNVWSQSIIPFSLWILIDWSWNGIIGIFWKDMLLLTNWISCLWSFKTKQFLSMCWYIPFTFQSLFLLSVQF